MDRATRKQTCRELVSAFERRRPADLKGERLHFAGVGDLDVYNITAPFADKGRDVIAGRVESRDSEHSQVRFFVRDEGREGRESQNGRPGPHWRLLESSPSFELQDPFVARIGETLVLGGVEIFPHPTLPGRLGWRTRFYRGAGIDDLEPFASGPDGMKDIRLVQLADGGIGVFTRPQGEIGGRGTIGFTRIESLEHLTPAAISEARLLANQFVKEEWGGANEAHLLRNGLIGVLGHIARFGPKMEKHYYPIAFAFDPKTEDASPMEVIAVRDVFPPGPAKDPSLRDVVFSGGIVRHPDGTADLYVGVSDAEAHRVSIPDPFIRYENQV